MHKKVFILFYFTFIQFLYPDTIILKDGTRLQGKITNQSRTKIEINSNGQIRVIDKNDITKIEFQSTEELKRKQEEERKKQEELKRQQEEERKKQEELKRQQEEERKKQEELKRQQEEERKKQEELKRQQEEERKKQEELKRQQEEERKKQEELKRQQEEERKKISPDDIKFVYLRSLVFPGWGHYRINEKNQSFLWGGLFWGFLIATVAQANKTISLQKDYDNFSKTQFTFGNLDIIPQELSLYFSSEATQKTQAIKKAINQTQALGIATVIIYLTQFYFLRNDLNSITLKDYPNQNEIHIVENTMKHNDFIRNYPANDSIPVWSYSTSY